jgi:hypothetical protein
MLVMSPLRIPVLLCLLSALAVPLPAAACVCCAGGGEWSETPKKLDQATIEVLQHLPLAGRLMFPGANNTEQPLAIAGRFNGATVVFTLEGDSKEAVARFVAQADYESFMSDDGNKRGVEGALYKELRLSGTLEVTGTKAPQRPKAARAMLVLQGRGNHCLKPDDLDHWTLRPLPRRGSESRGVRGYGDVAHPPPPPPEAKPPTP